MRRLTPIATQNLDAIAERLEDEMRGLNAKTPEAQKALAKNQIYRHRARLHAAYQQQREVREALLLDEEPPSGQP